MIFLDTSPKFLKVLKQFSIELDALQYSLSFILNTFSTKYQTKHINIKVVCRNGQKNYGVYIFNSKKIVIFAPSLINKETFLKSLLHEFRHWIQHTVDCIPSVAIISEGIKYDDNVYEQQCIKFEEASYPILLNLLEGYDKLKQLQQ